MSKGRPEKMPATFIKVYENLATNDTLTIVTRQHKETYYYIKYDDTQFGTITILDALPDDLDENYVVRYETFKPLYKNAV